VRRLERRQAASSEARRTKLLLRENRDLLLTLIEREIRSRYVGSLGGLAWALLHPLVLLGLYALLFRTIFQVRLPGEHSFVEFVAVGLWPWLAFQESVQRGAQSIRANASLVRKVAFPNELLVLAAVVATFGIHLLGFVLVLSVLALTGVGFAVAGMPLALIGLVALLCAAVAMAFLLGALQVFLPDVEQFLAPLFMVLFYATPILYPITLVPPWLQTILAWNPMRYLIEPVRDALIEGARVPHWTVVFAWLAAAVATALALRAFRRLSPHFEDFL